MISVPCRAGRNFDFDPAIHEATLAIIQSEDHLFGWIARSGDLLTALSRVPGVGA